MARRLLTGYWVLVGLVAGSAVFDWWMYRASQDYLIQAVQFSQGRAAEPDLAAQMAAARAGGLWRAAFWFFALAGGGWLTIRWSSSRPS